jgi:hypothetical protein
MSNLVECIPKSFTLLCIVIIFYKDNNKTKLELNEMKWNNFFFRFQQNSSTGN